MATLSDRLRRYSEKCLSEKTDPDFAAAVMDAADIVELIEHSYSVNPVRHGVWRKIKSTDEYRFWCSECGTEVDFEASNFCPNCGAAMKEVYE